MSDYEKKPQGDIQAAQPGDQAAPGTPGTGEALCPTCGGRGTVQDRQCPDCGGTGIVVQGIGGA